jgi:uncharacterized protein YbjT (DUF2867 family)
MKSSQNTEKTILVLGANGKTGSRVVQRLQHLGLPVRIGSRSAAIPFDWENENTWEPVVQNIHSVYITFQPDLAVPGSEDAIRLFTEIAVKNGVKKLVLLSGRGEPEAQVCEDIVMNAGIDWTIVRASWFNQNFSESYMLEPILAGHVAMPTGDTGEPFIDVEDIADVVTEALTDPGHSQKLYEVTGPRLLSFRQAIEEIAEATGRPIQFTQIPLEEYKDQLIAAHVPQEYISLLTYLFTEVLDGRNEQVADGVQQALGRKPKDFSEFVNRTMATGVWNFQIEMQS